MTAFGQAPPLCQRNKWIAPYRARRLILIWQRRQSLRDDLGGGVSGFILVTIRRNANVPGAPAGRRTILSWTKKKI